MIAGMPVTWHMTLMQFYIRSSQNMAQWMKRLYRTILNVCDHVAATLAMSGVRLTACAAYCGLLILGLHISCVFQHLTGRVRSTRLRPYFLIGTLIM